MIGIITESSADLPAELAEHHQIELVPFGVKFGDRTYLDRQDLTNRAFWDKLKKAHKSPVIEPPLPSAYQAAYQRSASRGTDELLVLCAAGRSSNADSAVAAANEIDLPVRVVDSNAVTISLGMMCIAGAEAAQLGAGSDDVLAAVNQARPELFGSANTVENLRKARRIGPARALVGNLMKLKPFISFEQGEIKTAGSASTRSRAVAALVQWLLDRPDLSKLAIVHGDAPDIDGIVARARDQLPGIEPLVVPGGPAVVIQAGPGFVAFAAGDG